MNWQQEWEEYELDLYEAGVKGRIAGDIRRFIERTIEEQKVIGMKSCLSEISGSHAEALSDLNDKRRKKGCFIDEYSDSYFAGYVRGLTIAGRIINNLIEKE